MKFFTFIFAFYILALSVMPCSDVHNECNDTNTKSELTKDHNHKSDTKDNCSPFCTCSCCNTTVALNFHQITFKVAKLFITDSKKIAIQDFSFVSNFYGNIWQPPKINV